MTAIRRTGDRHVSILLIFCGGGTVQCPKVNRHIESNSRYINMIHDPFYLTFF